MTEPNRGGEISLNDFERMKQTALFGDDDIAHLRASEPILAPQVEAILDTWYGFVASLPHLAAYFSTPEGELLTRYLDAVRVRFAQWIVDTARADYDQRWLDHQIEIGRRHHRVGKNRTDGVNAAAHIHFRYLIPLAVPIVHTLRPFLAAQSHGDAEVTAMQQAWLKSVLLQVSLWSHPYIAEGDF